MMDWVFNDTKKVLVFQVSASFLMLNKEDALDKIHDAIEKITSVSEKLICIFSPHESVAQVSTLAPELWENYCSLVEQLRETGGILIDDEGRIIEHIDKCSAYYGSPTNLAHLFQLNKKPVMIMDVNIR